MDKITYIIGAGASIQALPIVKDIPYKLEKFIEFLSDDKSILKNEKFSGIYQRVTFTKQYYQTELIDDLKWLGKNISDTQTIDYFAKELTNSGKIHDLKKLKILTVLFFAYEQAINEFDSRYSHFLTSIMKIPRQLPQNVCILSWNYDYQFELAYMKYSNNSDIEANGTFLNIQTKLLNNDPTSDQFCIIKLNGTACFSENSGHSKSYLELPEYDKNKIKNIEEMTLNYAIAMCDKYLHPSISFAWEPDILDQNIIDNAKTNVTDTTVLVVIGYSFPFYNRDIDRQILQEMKDLNKVYIQDPFPDTTLSNFMSYRNDLIRDQIIIIKDTNNFHLPVEM